MPIRPERLERELLNAGFKNVYKSGGHRAYVHPDGRTTEIPFHSGELKKFTEKKIRNEAGI